jgi:hypothetical protein
LAYPKTAMTGAELDQVAASLGIQLPASYRDFMLRHSAELEATQARLPHRAIVCFTPDNLLYYNRLVRAQPIGRAGVAWPAAHFVVGVHFCEDYWFIKLDGSDECLWTCWADTGRVEKSHQSLDDFLQELRIERERPPA